MASRSELQYICGMQFILNALRGGNPDAYYFENQKYIDVFLKQLRYRFKPKRQKIYRGILMHPDSVKGRKLTPLKHISYLSFSDDLSIAKVFADMNSDMAIPFRYVNPDHGGYLIEHEAEPEEIIFHHSWTDALEIKKFFKYNVHVVYAQREVMIKNSMKVFDLIPVERGCSNGQTLGVSYDSVFQF